MRAYRNQYTMVPQSHGCAALNVILIFCSFIALLISSRHVLHLDEPRKPNKRDNGEIIWLSNHAIYQHPAYKKIMYHMNQTNGLEKGNNFLLWKKSLIARISIILSPSMATTGNGPDNRSNGISGVWLYVKFSIGPCRISSSLPKTRYSVYPVFGQITGQSARYSKSGRISNSVISLCRISCIWTST